MPMRPPTHRPAHVQSGQYDQERGSACKRGYGRGHQRLRAMKLRADPICEFSWDGRRCEAAASEMDHVDGDARNLAWVNLRSACKACHSRKTVTENGGLRRWERAL